jgi:hypothetical protein
VRSLSERAFNEGRAKEMKVKESQCDCEKCSKMCRAPCCGIPADMERLMDAGFGHLLMYDDWPGGEAMLKPAMKGSEGGKACWDTTTERGCTFWRGGLCALHDIGLKPSQGKLAHHSNTEEALDEIIAFIREAWDEDKPEVKAVIERWKKLNNYKE